MGMRNSHTVLILTGRDRLGNKNRDGKKILQEVLGRTNGLLSLDTRWTAQKTKKLGVDTRTHRQKGDFINLLLAYFPYFEKVGL
jgi:hypothetical protein